MVVVNFIRRDGQRETFPAHFWLETEQWRQRDGDSRSVIFSWAGQGKHWPADDADAWNRAAFGPVPKDRRPTVAGTMIPQTPSQFTLYLDGVAPPPIGVAEFRLLRKRYGFFDIVSKQASQASMTFMLGSLTCVQALPDGGMTVLPAFATLSWPWVTLSPRDLGPPALPILMVRSTRQAVAENPLDAQSRACLIEALDVRKRQEDHWIGGFAPGRQRERVYRVQRVANLYALTQLQPENFDFHRRFAEVLAQEKMLDLALEQMQVAEKALEAYRPSSPNEQKNIAEMLKGYHAMVQQLDKEVRQRLAKWKDLCDTVPAGKFSKQEVALQKAAWAFAFKFEQPQDGNQRARATPLGLGKKAYEILAEIEPDSLPDRLRLADLSLRFELLLAMGQANDVMTSLKKDNIRKGLPPEIYADNLLLAGAALGDYAAMEDALAALDKIEREKLDKVRELVRERAGKYAPALLVMPTMGSAVVLASAAVAQSPMPLQELNDARESLHKGHNELSNTITLRGIIALEAGNTQHARVLFQRALDEAGETNLFTERSIARHYLDLLNEQKR